MIQEVCIEKENFESLQNFLFLQEIGFLGSQARIKNHQVP